MCAQRISSQLFDGLSEAEVHSVLAEADELQLQRNSIPVHQGLNADRLYMMVRGRARFFVLSQGGDKIVLRWITPGQVFGASSIACKPSPYLVGTEMTQDSIVLTWTRSKIRSLATHMPQLMENMFLISQEYLSWYVTAHETLITRKASERLAHLLIRLSESIGTRVSTGISLDVRNEELASAANMSVFTVSRLLGHWQQRRAIIKTRNRLVIRSRQLLLRNVNKI